MFFKLLLFLVLNLSNLYSNINKIPINIGASLDTVYEINKNFEIRSFELNIAAPVDPYFNFYSTLGFHEDEFHLEEAYVNTILPLNIKAQFGRELLKFGYLNKLHQHDFPQVDKPYVLKELLSEEGIIGEGVHIEYLASFINPTLSLTFGIYDKLLEDIGDKITGKPFLSRIETYYISPNYLNEVLVGLSYLNSFNKNNLLLNDDILANINYILGFDFKYKLNLNNFRHLNIGFEYIYLAHKENLDYVLDHDKGFYTYLQFDFDRYWNIGYRFDHTNTLYNKENNKNKITANSTYVSYKLSDFSRLRIQYQNKYNREENTSHILLLQGTFFIGWHPPHIF